MYVMVPFVGHKNRHDLSSYWFKLIFIFFAKNRDGVLFVCLVALKKKVLATHNYQLLAYNHMYIVIPLLFVVPSSFFANSLAPP